jgi:spermidine synthase
MTNISMDVQTRHIKLIYMLFFLSGFTALVYEVAWLNRIELLMGHTIYTLTAVISAYLSGLALGSLYSKTFIKKGVNTFHVYLVFELLIGIYGLFFYPLINITESLYGFFISSDQIPLAALSIIQFCFTFLLILIPTTLMGTTLPLLSHHLFKTKEELSTNISSLYGINTLGAFFGCMLAGYFILPSIGYFKTILLCALINLFIFLLATNYIESFKFPKWRDFFNFKNFYKQNILKSERFLLLVIFIAGFSSISMQILWNRYASLLFGASVYIFSLITGIVLLGIYLGSILSNKLLTKVNHEKNLLSILFISGILLLLGSHIFASSGILVHNLHQNFQVNFIGYCIFQFILSFLCLIPGATLLGALFPYSLSLYLKNKDDGAQGVAYAYALNILGVIIGSIIISFVVIPMIGIEGLKNLTPFIILLTPLYYFTVRNKSIYAAITLILFSILIIKIVPNVEKELLTQGYFYNRIKKTSDKELLKRGFLNWSSRHKSKRHKLIDYKDDVHATVSIHKHYKKSDQTWFKINGKVDGNTSPNDLTTVRMIALAPLLIRSDYQDILTIGLGTGETANLTADFPQMKTSDVVELSSAQIDFSKKYYKKYSSSIWSDKRFKVFNRDGREYLEHTKKKYDLIISEPSNPWQNGVGNLFTYEFFQTVSKRLKPKGVASIWLHLYGLECDAIESAALAAAKSFKYMAILKVETDILFMATNENTFAIRQLPSSLAKLEKILFNTLDPKLKNLERKKAYQQISKMWLMDSGTILSFDSHNPNINTDDNQYLQYSAAKTYWMKFACNSIFTAK